MSKIEKVGTNNVNLQNNKPFKTASLYSAPQSMKNVDNSEEKYQGVQIEEEQKTSNQPTSQMPESIPEPPKNGVSKKNLDGATSYNKEMLDGSDKDILREPMYRETIEYDDGTVITNIYEGDKLVKSIEDTYSGDPNDPKHGDTRDTTTYQYDENGNVIMANKNINDQNYIGEIGWADHLIPDITILYNENGDEIKEKILDPKTGKYINNPEYESKKREILIHFPQASRMFDVNGTYMGYSEKLEARLSRYGFRDPKYDKRPSE